MAKSALDLTRVVLVCTGTKYSEWFVENIKYMLQLQATFKIDEFCVVRNERLQGPLNKLQIFDYFVDGRNLYFDLDLVIRDKIDESIFQKDFTLLDAIWRPRYNVPFNSSVMSWTGDHSYIFDTYMANRMYYEMKYGTNDDLYLAEVVPCYTFPRDLCYSYRWDIGHTDNKKYKICLFNQRKELLESEDGWWRKYTLPQP